MQKPIYDAEGEQALMTRLWAPTLKDDPLAFVLYAFPWQQQGTPLAKFKGPRKWQREVLRDLAEHIQANKGRLEPQMLREAIAAGRGIGKSALVSWLILWMLSTRIGSTVIVSANSEAQLRSVTWGELTKWSTMIINAHWWEISATRLMPAKWLTDIVERDLKVGTRYWTAEGRLWSEENPDSYAGAHNHLGMMLILDEASGIPDQIWQVAAGFFTEPVPDRYWMVFSNPRRNSGYFFECFNAKRDFWKTKNIDARTVEDTDKAVYEQIIDEYGADSPQARVEVFGEFPLADDDQFIPLSLVEEAMKRPKYRDETAPIVIGIDPARSGMDSTVIAIRQGRDLIEIRRYSNQDTMQTVGCIIEAIEEFKPTLTVIDEGGLGYGILDRLNEQRYKVRGVNFAWASKTPIMYMNKRAELWGAMRDWLKSAALSPDRRLKADLTGVQQKLTSSGAIQLESKKDMRARGLASPDCFVAGTLVATPTGPRRIEELRAGDIVCTPFGNTPIFAAWETKTDSLTTVALSNGQTLVGTGKHKVFVWGQGEKRLDALALTDRLEPLNSKRFWLWQSLWSIAGSVSEFRQLVGITSRAGKLTPSGFYIAAFGQMLTGLYRKACTSITRITTGATTTLATWKWCLPASTLLSTPANALPMANLGRHQRKRWLKPLNGMLRQKAWLGMPSMENALGKPGSLWQRFVPHALNHTIRTFRHVHPIVQSRVNGEFGTKRISRTFGSVLGAAKTLWQTATAGRYVVPVSVQTESVAPSSVYNLTLEKHNAYYANGVLVFNCADAIAVTFAFPVARREPVEKVKRAAYAPGSMASSWMGA